VSALPPRQCSWQSAVMADKGPSGSQSSDTEE
jgi:hypothetical protein